jgi:hypothetical protein
MAADFGAQIEGDKVRFQRNNPGRIRFNALFTVGGNYTVNAAFRNQTGWSEPEIDISQFDVTQPTTGETTNQSINLICTAGSSASATDLIFSVSGTTDAGEEISVRYIQGVTAAT